jgi:hypothetical protein
MMKRFYFGGDEDNGEDEEGGGFEMPHPTEFISMGPMEDPFQQLMESAIRICEKSLVWRFTNPEDKIPMIKKVFQGLAEIRKGYEEDADI